MQVFATLECYQRCGLKYSVELGVYLQDIPVSIHNFRYVRECCCMLLTVEFYFCCFFLYFWIVLFFQLYQLSWFAHLELLLYIVGLETCLMIAQFLSNSVVVEQIAFSFPAWLYGTLLFRDLGCSDIACKDAYWSVGLRYKVVWMLLFSSLYNIASKDAIFLGEIRKWNLIVSCFSFNCFMNVINSAFVPFHIINMSSIYLRYSRDFSLMYG